MKYFKIYLMLIYSSTNLIGQTKTISQILTYEYSVKKIGDKFEKDQLSTFYFKNYNKDGTEQKMKIYGSSENPKNDKFDERGNKIEWNLYNPDGSISFKYLYKYDVNNNKIEEKSYNEKGGLLIKQEYDYDANNNQIRCEKFENETLSFYKTISKYDSLNNQIEWIGYTYNKFNSKLIFKYDSLNRLIEENETDSTGLMISKKLYQYSSINELMQETEYDSKNTVLNQKVYEYLFDDFGTWITMKILINDKLVQIIERQIRYFD